MKKDKIDTSYWDQHRGKIYSSKGGWIIGRGVLNQGYEMMSDFVGRISYMQLLVFNAIGRMLDRTFADWLEASYICMSWPDPRIWCNHIGALGGTARASILASTAAGDMATDARAYGVKPLLEGLAFIQQALENSKQGLSVQEIVKNQGKFHGGKPQIMGYARPIAKGDERVTALEVVRKELKIEEGEHLKLAFAIHNYIYDEFGESININGYVSAILSDQGFSPQDAYRIFCVLVSSGVTACYVDTRSKPAESFLPLQCTDIQYQGVAPRSVPD